MDPEQTEIESKSDYSSTPQGRQQRWGLELDAAKKALKDFHGAGKKVIDEYLGKGGTKRLNLFYADVQTKAATLAGVPKVRARRRHADAKDDVARVSADLLERLLNTDVERDSDGFRRSLDNAKGDWLKPGLGQIRFRYVVEENAEGVKTFEDVETDYVHWDDYLWSPCRCWDEVRWTAYGADMSRDALHKRFDDVLGAKIVNLIPLNAKTDGADDKVKDILGRARVWEIWDKEAREVAWLVEGFDRILDTQPDPLGLPNFFPSPAPLAANVTTSDFVPRSTFFLAEDLYEEAHELTRRIRALVKTIKVVGAYAKGNEALERVLDDACENQLVPVTSLAALINGDGVGEAAWFMPIAPMVEALVQLVQQRNLVRADIAEVLGLSDIMRGQQAQRATATTDRIKARAFSMRSQTDQDEFARFASDAQRIRAFILSRQFDPATIIARSNADQAVTTEDANGQKVPNKELIARAVELLKSDISAYRVEVDAESLSMTDFDAVQQDAMAFMTATSEFFQRWAPLMQGGGPGIAKFALELYQQFASQIRGAQRFEDIIDRAVAELEQAASQPPPPPQPDPKVEAEKVKAGAVQAKAQADVVKTKLDVQAAQVKHGMEMQKMAAQQQQDEANFGMRMAEARSRREEAADFQPGAET